MKDIIDFSIFHHIQLFINSFRFISLILFSPLASIKYKKKAFKSKFGDKIDDVLFDTVYGTKELFSQYCQSEFAEESLLCWEATQKCKSIINLEKKIEMAKNIEGLNGLNT